MYQPKVENVEKYSDSQGTHLAHKGKLLLVHENTGVDPNPIIISEVEEIEVGDYVMHKSTKELGYARRSALSPTKIIVDFEASKSYPTPKQNLYKILVLPDQFSQSHLQVVENYKIKDGDEVLVKCNYKVKSGTLDEHNKGEAGYEYGKIHLNRHDHITLFPVKEPGFKCPNCGCEEIHSYHTQSILGGKTIQIEECDECGRMVDPSPNEEQSLEEMACELLESYDERYNAHLDEADQLKYIRGVKDGIKLVTNNNR